MDSSRSVPKGSVGGCAASSIQISFSGTRPTVLIPTGHAEAEVEVVDIEQMKVGDKREVRQ